MNNSDNIAELLTITNNKLSRGYSISAIEKELKFGKDTLRRKLNRAGYRYSKNDKKFIRNNDDINNKYISSKSSNSASLRNEHNNNTYITQAKEHTKNTPITQSKESLKNTIATQDITQNKKNAGNTLVTQNITQIKQPSVINPVTQTAASVNSKNTEHKENTSVTQNAASAKTAKANNTEPKDNTKTAQIKKFTAEDISIIFKLIENYKLKEKKDYLNYEKDNNDVITRSVRSYRSVLDNFSNFCKKHNLSQKDAFADALVLYMRSQN